MTVSEAESVVLVMSLGGDGGSVYVCNAPIIIIAAFNIHCMINM